MQRFFLALITALALALPAAAQVTPLAPYAPDSLYLSGDVFGGWTRKSSSQVPTPEYEAFLADQYERFMAVERYKCTGHVPFYFTGGDKYIIKPIMIYGYHDGLFGRIRQEPAVFTYGEDHRGMPAYEHSISILYTFGLDGKTHLGFELTGRQDSAEDEMHHVHLWETGYFVVRSDTVYLRDGRKPFGPYTTYAHCGFSTQSGGRNPRHYDGYHFTLPDVPFAFANNEVTPFAFYAQVFVPPAELPEQNLLAYLQRKDGKDIPGAVWLSWRLPGDAEDPAAQVEREKELWPLYQYYLLRDGDYVWRSVDIKDTELDGIDTVITRRDELFYQRRRMLVTGLDPDGEYSFCVRMVNVTSTSEEVCNLASFKPVTAEREQPKTVALRQNYPNPFNPSTAIEWDLFAPMRVRLEVFDAIGRSVGVLVDGMRPAGTNTFRFDADGLPSGLYVYRLQAGGETFTKKMTLTR